jgi:hypothetical protein
MLSFSRHLSFECSGTETRTILLMRVADIRSHIFFPQGGIFYIPPNLEIGIMFFTLL